MPSKGGGSGRVLAADAARLRLEPYDRTGCSASDDIGNWLESLGLASLFVEGAVLLLSGNVILEPVVARGTGVQRRDAGARSQRRRSC